MKMENLHYHLDAFIINFNETIPSEIVKCKSRNGASASDEFPSFKSKFGWLNLIDHTVKVGIINRRFNKGHPNI